MRFDAEVGAASGRLQIGSRGTASPAPFGRQMVIARAFLLRAIEVVIARNAKLARAGDDRLDEFMLAADRRTPERAIDAVKGRIAEGSVLEPPEIRQHLGVAPPGIAGGCPSIVILALAAQRYETVNRARAAERLAARPIDVAAVHPGIGFGIEAPIDASVEHRLRVADRNVDPRIGVGRAGLQQKHRMASVGREAIRPYASGRARADNNVVE